MGGRVVNSRISVTEETRDIMREFANGSAKTYEDVMMLFFSKFIEPGEDPYMAGRRWREEIERLLKDREKGKAE